MGSSKRRHTANGANVSHLEPMPGNDGSWPLADRLLSGGGPAIAAVRGRGPANGRFRPNPDIEERSITSQKLTFVQPERSFAVKA
jgi:hypothetical protein